MNLLDQVKAAAAGNQLKDQTAEESSNFQYEPPVAGKAYARFVSYVELGKRAQKAYQGKDKPPAYEVRLGFELLGKKHAKEVEVSGEKKIVYPMIFTKLAIKGGDRATFTKLLKAMSYGRDIKHMAMMLGEGFVVTVVHNYDKTDSNGKPLPDSKTYANLRNDAGWLIGAPMVPEDPSDPTNDKMKPVTVPPATAPIQLLLWDSPTKEQWDSIFIDGTREVKDDNGNVKTVSKNWVQEDIQKALDFDGSAVQALLLELAGNAGLTGGRSAPESLAEDALDGDAPAVAETAKASPAPADEAPDPLAAFGDL